MLAKDYIKFLLLLWKRVRPDLLFPPPPPPEGEKPPPTFSTTLFKGKDKTTQQKGRRNSRRKAAAHAVCGEDFPSSGFHGRTPPPHPAPPPSTPIGLLALNIPGFRPKEAQRAAWVRKGGIIDPEFERLLRPAVDLEGLDGGDVGSSCPGGKSQLNLEQKEVEEPGWKERGRQRLLAAGVVKERGDSSGRPGVGTAGSKGSRETKDLDSVWDFASRSFPVDPREVSGRALVLVRG